MCGPAGAPTETHRRGDPLVQNWTMCAAASCLARRRAATHCHSLWGWGGWVVPGGGFGVVGGGGGRAASRAGGGRRGAGGRRGGRVAAGGGGWQGGRGVLW